MILYASLLIAVWPQNRYDSRPEKFQCSHTNS
jgi:hypothetical protein